LEQIDKLGGEDGFKPQRSSLFQHGPIRIPSHT
jgi:hypothetical protein